LIYSVLTHQDLENSTHYTELQWTLVVW